MSDRDRTTDALGREEARTDRRGLQEASWDRSAKETRDLSGESELWTHNIEKADVLCCLALGCLAARVEDGRGKGSSWGGEEQEKGRG